MRENFVGKVLEKRRSIMDSGDIEETILVKSEDLNGKKVINLEKKLPTQKLRPCLHILRKKPDNGKELFDNFFYNNCAVSIHLGKI